MGLPVHRVRTPNGQSIYARRSEIQAWLQSAELHGEPLDGPLSHTGEPAQATRGWWLIGVGVALAVVAVLTLSRLPHPMSDPSMFVFSGKSLEARDADRRVLWQYTFNTVPEPLAAGERPHAASGVQRADIDGDGADEALAIVRLPADATRHSATEELYCWTLDGTLRWVYRPQLTLAFLGGTFTGPWKLLDFIHTPSLRDPLWVSIGHEQWWAGALVSLDRNGHPTLRFVHGGLMFALGYSEVGHQRRVLAAGVSNGAGAGALIALDPDAAAASWPQDPQSMFRCLDCPRAAPAGYLLLPRTELGVTDSLPYSTPRVLRVHERDVEVIADETQDGVANTVFTVDPSFTHGSFGVGDDFWTVHRRLETEGKLTHDSSHCPQARQPMAGRSWTPAGGWRSIEFTPAVLGIPATEKF